MAIALVKGRHVSTARAIELLEEYGMDTPQGFIKPAQGLLTKAVGSQREYIEWLLSQCTAEGIQLRDVLEVEAIDLLARN